MAEAKEIQALAELRRLRPSYNRAISAELCMTVNPVGRKKRSKNKGKSVKVKICWQLLDCRNYETSGKAYLFLFIFLGKIKHGTVLSFRLGIGYLA